MPSLQPYGGAGWALSCLLPPSAISLFASVLVKHEAAQQASFIRNECSAACRGGCWGAGACRCGLGVLLAWSKRSSDRLPSGPLACQQGLTWRSLSQPVTVEHSFRWAQQGTAGPPTQRLRQERIAAGPAARAGPHRCMPCVRCTGRQRVRNLLPCRANQSTVSLACPAPCTAARPACTACCCWMYCCTACCCGTLTRRGGARVWPLHSVHAVLYTPRPAPPDRQLWLPRGSM